MFFLGASKNLGAQSLVEATEALLSDVRAIIKCVSLVPVPSLPVPPCFNDAERNARRAVLISAAQAVCMHFDQVSHDTRRAAPELARLCGLKGGGANCDSFYAPDLDQIFTQAALQTHPDPVAANVLRKAH